MHLTILNESQRESLRSHLAECHDQYLATERGLLHIASYARARKEARANFDHISQLRASNGDWQDQVLLTLLPHQDTPHNRAKGAWTHIAPAVTRDLKQWFENAGWTRPEQWPDVAAAVLDFVSEAVRNPDRLKLACQAFANNASSKGMQSGFLSPILNALRPEDYRIVNSKTLKVLKEFIGENHSQKIIEYPESNEAAGRFVAAVREFAPSGLLADALDCDVADAFCHWYVALRPKTDRIAIQRLTDRNDPVAAEAWLFLIFLNTFAAYLSPRLTTTFSI
jgi:5-methylcytosine-specific restriction protein B